MVDVTKENFSKLLPDVLEEIKGCAFISLDTEFTGLLSNDVFRGSLFDNGEQRYHKLCKNMSKFTICQLGLSMFKGIPHKNAYTVKTFNFYLRPHSCVSFDPTILCQTSSLEFLQRYKFDFNKWLYSGVGSMNSDEEKQLRMELMSIYRGDKIVDVPYTARDQLSEVGVWASTASEGDTTTISHLADPTLKFLLIVGVRNRFEDVWASIQNGEVVVQKVGAADYLRLESLDPCGKETVESLVEEMLGFTTIFHHMAKLQKPLVLHNCLLDLILLYKQCHHNLPSSYSSFKDELHKLFPMIYDTKALAADVKKNLKEKEFNTRGNGFLANTSLSSLASFLKKDQTALHKPSILHVPEENKYSGADSLLHEAGYDAYLTGTCFLYLAHLYTMLQLPTRASHRPMSPREHVYALKPFMNRINLPMASVPFMVLSGRDPRSKRPPWLVVENLRKSHNFSPNYVSSILARYGHVDITPHTNKSMLVAAASWDCTRDILKDFRNKESAIRVMRYSRLKHSPVIRTLALSGAMVSAGLSSWLIYTALKKSTF